MSLLALDVSRIIANIAWGSLIILVFFILYRLLLNRMKRGRISPAPYLILHPLEKDPASGTVQFYVELKEDMPVRFSVYSQDETTNIVIKDEVFPKGGNIISFDTTTLPNGVYYFEAKTEIQKTGKKFVIRN